MIHAHKEAEKSHGVSLSKNSLKKVPYQHTKRVSAKRRFQLRSSKYAMPKSRLGDGKQEANQGINGTTFRRYGKYRYGPPSKHKEQIIHCQTRVYKVIRDKLSSKMTNLL